MSKLRATLVTMLVLAVGLFVYSPVAFAGHGFAPNGPNEWHSDTMTINETGSLGVHGTDFVPAWVRTDCDTPILQGLSTSNDDPNALGCHAFAEEVLDQWLVGGWWDPRGGTEFIPPSGDHHRAGWRLMMQAHFSAGQWLTGFATLADIFPFYPQVGLKGAGETPVGVYELCADPDGAAINGAPADFDTGDDPVTLGGPNNGLEGSTDPTADVNGDGFVGDALDILIAGCRQEARVAGALLLEFVDHHGEPLTPGRFPRYIPHERQAWVSTLVTKYTASPSTNVDSTPDPLDPDATVSDITGARVSQVFRTQHNFVTQENPLIQQHGVAVWFSMSDESGSGCTGGWCKWSWDPVAGQLCRAYANPGNDTIESVCGYTGARDVDSVATIHDNPGAGGPGYEAEAIGNGNGICEDGEPCAGDDGFADGNPGDTGDTDKGDDNGICIAAETDCYGNPDTNAATTDNNGDTVVNAADGFKCDPGDFCRRDISTVEKAPSEIYQTLGQWVDLAGPSTGGVWGSGGAATNQNQALWTEFWALSGPNFQSEEGINPNTWLKCGIDTGDFGCQGTAVGDGDGLCEDGEPCDTDPAVGPVTAKDNDDGFCDLTESCSGPGDANYDFDTDGDTIVDLSVDHASLAITSTSGLDPVLRWGEDMRPNNAQDLGCVDGDTDGNCNEGTADTDCSVSPDPGGCDAGIYTATVVCYTGGDTDGDARTSDCLSDSTNGVYGDGDDGMIYYKEVVEEGLRGFLRHNRTIAFSFANGSGGGHNGNLSGTMRQIMAQNLADGMTLSCLNCENEPDHFVQNHAVPSYTFSFDVSGVDFVEHSSITPGSGVIP